jgi:hypothetical protein
MPDDQIKQLPGLIQGRVSNGSESFGEYISSFPNGFSIPCQMEKHPAILIESVFADKVNAMDGKIQPLLLLLYLIVERGQHPGKPAGLPHALIGIQPGTIPVYRKHKSTQLGINTMPDPEGDGVIQQSVTVDPYEFVSFL